MDQKCDRAKIDDSLQSALFHLICPTSMNPEGNDYPPAEVRIARAVQSITHIKALNMIDLAEEIRTAKDSNRELPEHYNKYKDIDQWL